MNPQEIFERATLMLERNIPRHEVDEWVKEQTGQGDGFPLSYGQLRQSFESPQEAMLRRVLAIPGIVESAPGVAVAALKLVRGIPEAIVEKLAGDVDPETGFRDPATGGLTAVGDALEAGVQFVVDDLTEFGPGAFIEGGGGTAAAGFIRGGGKAEVAARKAAELAGEGKRLKGRGLPIAPEVPPSKIPGTMPTVEELAARQAQPGGRLDELLPEGPSVSSRPEDVMRRQGIPEEMIGPEIERLRQGGRPPTAQAAATQGGARPPIDPDLPVLERVEQVRQNYMASKGYEDVPIPQLGPGDTDEAFHKKWAQIYDRAGKDVNPETTKAWRQMVREVEEQAEWLGRAPEDGGAGVRFDFVAEDPYKNHAEMLKDLEESGSIKVFKTPKERVVEGAGEGGLGSIPPDRIGGTEDMLDFHPLIEPQENDLFRGIHDVLGHGVGRNTFDLHGETQAAWQHMAMFSPEARPAVAVETLGQNSAFYHGARPNAFQEQKVFMPHDERLFGIGYQNVDDVPVALVPDEGRGLADHALAGSPVSSPGVSDDLAESVLKLGDDYYGSTVDPRTGENLAGRDLWATSNGTETERMFDHRPTKAEMDQFVLDHQGQIDADPDLMLGTWDDRPRGDYDPEAHGQYEVNLTRTFDKQGDVRNFSMDKDQVGYVNLADENFETVHAGDAFQNARKRVELDNSVDARRERRLQSFKENATDAEWEAFHRMPSGRRVAENQQQRILDHYSLMPETEEGAAFALLGAEAGRWYQSSAAPLFEMFGDDAPRLIALNAALSPNTPVLEDLGATIDIWGDWIEAGRPKDRGAMEGWLDEAKRKWGVTPTNLNNIERVLTATPETLLEPRILERGGLLIGQPKGPGLGKEGEDVLSGLKISPFRSNLMGYLQRYVMDTHMKRVTGFTGQPSVNKAEAFGSQVAAQRYAKFLTEVTGKPWQAGEVQAAQWAVARALKDMSGKRNLENVPELLQAMGLPEAGFSDLQSLDNFEPLLQRIREAPSSIGEIMHDPKIQPGLKRLEEMGAISGPPPPFANDLSKLDSFLDDPQVRLGDLLDIAKRMAQSTGESLPALIAGLMARGVMDSVNGRELLTALAEEGGLNGVNNVAEAYDLNPGGTMELLMLMGEQPDIEEAGLQRFGDALRIEQAPDLIRTLRGSAADPEPVGRNANIRRFGPIAGRRAPVSPVAPPPPVPRPAF